jgi:transposase InsO family protein
MDRTTIERSHPMGERTKYLIRDRDKKYASHFSAVAMNSGIKELKTPFRTPQVHGYCERFMSRPAKTSTTKGNSINRSYENDVETYYAAGE